MVGLPKKGLKLSSDFPSLTSQSLPNFLFKAILLGAVLALLTVNNSVEAATIVVRAGGSVQSAINAAKYGDTIKLEAGAKFDTPGQFAAFNLIDKGTPPTGTDAD